VSRPTRYTFILALAALAIALAALGGWRFARASAPVSGPIVLISIDALRPDRLPVYGYDGIATPAIDTLAADGVVFDRAYSHSPQTLPAHASLLSGRLPFDTGVRDSVGFTIRPDERMLAEMLSDRGFETAGIVSSYVLRAETGIDQGFAFFDSDLPRIRFGGTVGPLLRDSGASQRLAEDWLASAGDARSFLFLHLAGGRTPFPPGDRLDRDAYDDKVAYADEIVGRMVRFLKSHQLYDQATIILVSDHGMGLGDHGEWTHGLFVYEEALRVPLIIKAPGGRGAGRRVDAVVQHIDLVPTILDLAKAPVPRNLGGRSLVPVIDDSRALPPRFVYSESLYARYRFGWGDLTSLTDGRLRFISAPREELYDLALDPDERSNVVDDRPEEAADLRAALVSLEATSELPEPAPVSVEDRQRLEALGYVGRVGTPAESTSDATTLDPKDAHPILEAYRAAVDRVVDRQWPQAMSRLQAILRDHPDLPDVWRQLGATASLAGRHERSIDAYRRALRLNPDDAETRLQLAGELLRAGRLEEARQEAELAGATLSEVPGTPVLAEVYELLARVALANGDDTAARAHAVRAEAIDPDRPLALYVDGRLHDERGRLPEALASFEQALASLERSGGRPIADLNYRAAEVLMRLERFADAEPRFLAELDAFPQHARSWAGLATLYHATGRTDEASATLAEFVMVAPTPDTFAVAARLWTAFGHPDQAASVRAEARRRFAPDARPEPRALQ
jgi:arylsulfatase A-like enzyme/uncharacterized protein HemY